MLLSSAVVALSLQAATAVPAQDAVISETWELAYDVAITPFVEDYRRCLNYGNRIARGLPDFEQQHRSDLPRCTKVYQESIEASNRMMERRGREELFTPEDVTRVFDTIGYIHVQRGRFVDDSLRHREQRLARYTTTHAPSQAPLDQPEQQAQQEVSLPNAEN